MSDQTVAQRATLTVAQAAERLGVSKTFAYDAIARGQLPVIKLGRKLLVPRPALDRMLGEGNMPWKAAAAGAR